MSDFYKVGLDTDSMQVDAMRASNALKSIGDKATAEGARIDSAFRSASATVGSIFAAQKITDFGGEIIRVRGEIESFEISFRTLLGNKEKADAMFASLKDFAVKTPLQLNDLAKGAQMLLGFGVSAERIMPTLHQIGDVSMGNTERFNSLTIAFSQVSAAGKLTGQDLLQMVNAGFNPLTLIAEKSGKTVAQLKDEMSKGAISAEMVAKAFADAAGAGGKFNGMLEMQSKGINGAKSNFEGAVNDMLNKWGTNNQEMITDGYAFATSMVSNYDAVGTSLATLIALVGVHKAALIANEVWSTSTERAKNVAMLNAEAAALKTLETAETKELLTKKGLKVGSVEYTAALKAEVLQKLENQKATLAQITTEQAAAQASYRAALSRSLAATQKLQGLQVQLALGKQSGNQELLNATYAEVHTAKMAKQNAVREKQIALTMLSTKNAEKEAAANALNTTQTVVNTAGTAANTAAKSFSAKVTGLLTAATTKLNAVLASNVWTLAAVAIAALAYGMYKLITYQTDAEKAQAKLNDRVKEFNSETEAEQAEIDRLFGKLDNLKEGTKEYDAVKKAIIDKYGIYLQGLSDEVTALKDVAGAYQAISAAAKQAATDRAISDASSTAQKDWADKQVELVDSLEKAIRNSDKFRGKKGIEREVSATIQMIKNDLKAGGKLSTESQKIVSGLTKQYYTASSFGSGKFDTGNDVQVYVNRMLKNNDVLEQTFKSIQTKLGNDTNQYVNQTAEQLATNIATFEKALAQFDKTGSQQNVKLHDGSKIKLEGGADISLQIKKLKEAQEEQKAQAKKKAEQDKGAETVGDRELRWKKELIEAEKQLASLKENSSKATEEEIETQQKEVDKLKKSLNLDSKSVNSAQKKQEEANRIKVENAERQKQIDEYGRKISGQIKQSEIEISQSRIDGMEEGATKERDQIGLNYKKLIFANQQRQAEMVKELQEAERLEWENKNPKHKEQGLVFTPTKMAGNLSGKQQSQLTEYTKIANEYKEKAEAQLLKSLSEKYQDYTDQRIAIEKRFNDDIAALKEERKKAEAKGDTPQVQKIDRSIAQATKNKGESLVNLDFEQLKKEPEYIRAFENLKQTSTETLNSLLSQLENAKQSAAQVLSPDQLREYTSTIQSIMDELTERNPFQMLADRKRELAEAEQELAAAKKQLEDVQKSGGKKLTSASLNTKTGKVDTSYITAADAMKKYNEAQDKVTKKSAQVNEAEKKVTDSISDLSQAMSDVGGSIGGLTGEIISMIGGIGTTVMTAIQGLSAASQASSSAIKAVEKASVILAIIGAAIQLATKVVSLFAADYSAYNAAKEAYESYAKVLDTVINKQKELIETMSGENAKNAYNYALELIDKQSQAARTLGKERLNSGASVGSHSIGVRINKGMSGEGWDEAKKALGKDFYDYGIGDGRMTGLFDLSVEQLNKLESEAPTFWAKLDGDVREYLESIIESGEKIEEMQDAWKENLTNISFDSVYEEFLDTLYDMDADSSDFAKNFADYMRKAMIKSMFDKTYKAKLEEWYDLWAKSMENDGVIDEQEQTSLDSLKNSIVNGAQAGADLINEQFKDVYDEANREGSSKGVAASASQDSMDEANGRMTVIQSHTFSMSESLKMLVSFSVQILEKLTGIETNTNRLEAIEGGIKSMKNGIDALNKGIKLKKT